MYITALFWGDCFYYLSILLIDILQGIYRRKLKGGKRCTSMNRFLFSWTAMAQEHENKQLPVEKSILRVYMEVIPRLLNSQRSAVVTIEAYMKLSGQNDSMKVLGGEHSVTVTTKFEQWVEINVTGGIRKLWPPTMEEPDLEVTLVLRTDCRLSRKVPAAFTNPATISLSQAKRRKRLSARQPFLVIHLSDETIKEIVRNESINDSTDEGDLETASIQDGNTASGETRGKRFASVPGCQLENYFVNFSMIEINYIQAPVGYNARQCKGSCDHDFLTVNGRFGNNYAKIMAGTRKVYEIEQQSSIKRHTFSSEPKGPCCVPTKYSSMTMIEMGKDRNLKYTVYPSMVVESCGCR